MSISQKLCVKYNDSIAEFVSKNPDSKKLKNFIPTTKTLIGPLKISLCRISLYEVEHEEDFLSFIDYLVIQNFDLLDVFYEVSFIENVRILEIKNNELLESALWILFSFFGNNFQILGCVLHLDVKERVSPNGVEYSNSFPSLSNLSDVNGFIQKQKVFSEVKIEKDKNEQISSILLFGKSLGEDSRWKIFSPYERFMIYELSLEKDELQKVNEIYQRKSNLSIMDFNVLFFESVRYLNEMYYQKAFFVCDSFVTYPLLNELHHLKRDLNDLIIFQPSLLGSCKKRNFRLFWAFYSLCCLNYWSFKLPPEICIYHSNNFSEKNPLMISFYLSDFLSQARLSDQNKNRDLVIRFFLDFNSAVETGYFNFSSLVLDVAMKRNKGGIYFQIELNPVAFFKVFNPSVWFSTHYYGDIWAEFLKYAQQEGFTEKQMHFYMQAFFVFYSKIFILERYKSFLEIVPFKDFEDCVEPVSDNSKGSKEKKIKHKIYLTMICFLVEKCFRKFILRLYGKRILSYEELLSMPKIPFYGIDVLKRDQST